MNPYDPHNPFATLVPRHFAMENGGAEAMQLLMQTQAEVDKLRLANAEKHNEHIAAQAKKMSNRELLEAIYIKLNEI